ncbi:MAG: nucleotide excision repair endonuclease, partial [Fibrobacter sp.]|nr:nucleotide excision repair endonuclease [Fibrobacter sp.]
MHDDIIEFLKNHPEGVSSLDLANTILKMTNAPQTLADSMIKGILSKDCRCQQGNNGLWYFRAAVRSSNCKSFNELQFTAVFIVTSPSESGKQILYLSLWDLIPEPHYKWGAWLTDPNMLPACDQEMIVGPDYQFNPDNAETAVIRAANDLEKTIPIFLTSHNYNLLRLFCMNHGIFLTDNAMLAGEFLKTADITIPKPINLLTLQKAVFDTNTLPPGPYKQGEIFAGCISELIRLMMERGITCREQMEELLANGSSKFFVNKAYDYSLINSLPEAPGVYGFQDKHGKYIYIGKARNLKRRIGSYFRSTEEFPKKLQQLHDDSYS